LDPRFDLINILNTAVRVVTSPVHFFKEMPRTGGYTEPLVFMVVMGLIGAFLQAMFSVTGLQPVEMDIDTIPLIMMLTIAIVISGFILAAIYFAIWRVMGSQESFETAYRCYAYISALTPVTTILNLIPFFAPALSVILLTIFLVIASVYVHNLSPRKSWIVFGALGLIFLMVSVTGEIAVNRLKGELEMHEQFDGREEPGREEIDNFEDI
jgi:hypothetical protein